MCQHSLRISTRLVRRHLKLQEGQLLWTQRCTECVCVCVGGGGGRVEIEEEEGEITVRPLTARGAMQGRKTMHSLYTVFSFPMPGGSLPAAEGRRGHIIRYSYSGISAVGSTRNAVSLTRTAINVNSAQIQTSPFLFCSEKTPPHRSYVLFLRSGQSAYHL